MGSQARSTPNSSGEVTRQTPPQIPVYHKHQKDDTTDLMYIQRKQGWKNRRYQGCKSNFDPESQFTQSQA